MADKTKTVKGATDKELDELLVRLQKENHLVDLIADLKRKSTPADSFNAGQEYHRTEVSTEQPINSLYHYGILGMRWGIRRQRGSDGRVISGTREKRSRSEDHKQARELKKKAPTGLSTAELQTLNKRLQLEKEYKNLDPNSYNKGLNAVAKITRDVGTVAGLYAVTQTALGQEIIEAVKSKVG